MEKEENKTEISEQKQAEVTLGKFKSVDALVRAYEQLEAEFTRRSQRLKLLEESKAKEEARCEQAPSTPSLAELSAEDLYRAINENAGVKAQVVSDYLSSLKGVPLMTGGGVGVTAPKTRLKSIAEAGELALGYFRSQKKT